MRVYIEASGRRVEPFNDPVDESLIGNRPLKTWLDEALTDAGLERIDTFDPPCLVIPDTLFCTGKTLTEFLDGTHGENSVLVLETSRFGRYTTPVQPHVVAIDGGWRFDKIRFHSGGDEPLQDVVSPMALPTVPPVVEIAGFTISRHAEFIFDYFRPPSDVYRA